VTSPDLNAPPSESRVQLTGDVDLPNVERIEGLLADALDLGAAVTVVDLREVAFMDSSGLRLLMQADASARDAGRRLRVVQGPESVRRLFRLARLQDHIEIVDDVD
jgi:anti-sigma B factor antagonist